MPRSYLTLVSLLAVLIIASGLVPAAEEFQHSAAAVVGRSVTPGAAIPGH